MLALLKLVPLKDWLYCGAILVLLAGFVTYTVHERHIGEQKIEAADAKVVAAQTAANKASEEKANASIAESVQEFNAAVAAPTLPVPQLLCRPASGGGAVPSRAPAPGPSDDTSVGPEATGPSFDPSERVLAVGRDADAQIVLLQNYIRALQAQGVVSGH